MLKKSLLVAALAFVSTVGSVAGASAATSDSWITAKTKIALMTTEGVSTKSLNVDTVNGVVTLHGMVAVETEKEKAGRVARDIDGVKDVKNLLQVVPDARRDRVEASDATVKDGVEKAFKANHRIAGSGIKVASVNKGVVLLSGKTKSIEGYLESVQVADAVKGVRRVSTEVEVVQP